MNKIFALIAVAVFFAAAWHFSGLRSETKEDTSESDLSFDTGVSVSGERAQTAETAVNKNNTKPMEQATELKVEITQEGTGDRVTKKGDTIGVHYTGMLTDGTKFDSSLDRGEPFEFQLGAGMVIRGWDEGLVGMKVGEKRRLTIPASMGYGERGTGGVIPPNATLVFETELISIR